MKKGASIFIVVIFLLLLSGSLISCSADRETNADPKADGQENIPGGEARNDMDTEKTAMTDVELIAPPLSYDYSQADEKYIYYIYDNEIRRYDRATGAEQSIYQSKGRLQCMEKYQDYLYFIESLDESGLLRLYSVSVDGKDVFLIDGNINDNALGITDNYLFVRGLRVEDGSVKIIDTVYEVKGGKGKKFEPNSINYEYANNPDINTNLESTEIQRNGEALFRAEKDESVNLLAYNSKYVVAEIRDEDWTLKQILFYDLEQNTSEVCDYGRQIDIHAELHGEWAVLYLFDYPLEVKLVDLTESDKAVDKLKEWEASKTEWETSKKQQEAAMKQQEGSQKEGQEPYTDGEWIRQNPLETNAKIIYDEVLAEQGYTCEVCYNAKGNLYLNLGSRPAGEPGDYYDTGTYCFTLVYDRTSKNSACELFVLYKEHYTEERGNLSSNDATAILDMYAVEVGTGKVVASGKQAWSDVGTAEYRELTGE